MTPNNGGKVVAVALMPHEIVANSWHACPPNSDYILYMKIKIKSCHVSKSLTKLFWKLWVVVIFKIKETRS